MTPTELEALEAAACAAWPALEEDEWSGWRLRAAGGYTKRANSANATSRAVDLDETGIAAVEQWFRARRLPSIFRLCSFNAPPGIDDRLAGRGYRFTDMSLVLARPLAESTGATEPVCAEDAASWLQAFQAVSGKLGPEQAIHWHLLQAIRGECAYAVAPAADGARCCGLGVIAGDSLGLFDVATGADSRRHGLARELCAGLLSWGARRGARRAFLQVVAANGTAIRLYESLGFRRVYHYWYRVAE